LPSARALGGSASAVARMGVCPLEADRWAQLGRTQDVRRETRRHLSFSREMDETAVPSEHLEISLPP
jgi:hypothetical protein